MRNVDYAGLDGPGVVAGLPSMASRLAITRLCWRTWRQCSLGVSVSAFSAVESKPGPIPVRAAPVAVSDVIVTDSNERAALSDPHLHSN
jgi:hypothetical protein